MGSVSDDELDDVVRREQQLLDPAVRASGDQVRALLHPDFIEYGASGKVWTRAEITAALESDPGVSGDGTDFCPVALADDVVLLTYRIAGRTGALRSSVWVRDTSAGWRLRFHQGTPLHEPESQAPGGL
jgi:ribonuclease HI